MCSAWRNFSHAVAVDVPARSDSSTDVIIVAPPFISSAAPVLGASLLVEGCRRRGLSCRVFYANLIFAAMLGPDLYESIAALGDGFIGEAHFAPYAFSCEKEELIRFLTGLAHSPGSPGESDFLARYHKVDDLIPNFLQSLCRELIGTGAKIIGFSSSSLQNASSIAIAKLLKEAVPEIVTAMGGGSVPDPIGKALSEIAPAIDYFFSGEADLEFPRFCEAVLQGRHFSIPKLIDCGLMPDMDASETPDFDDYYEQLSALQEKHLLPAEWPSHIVFESSRGCWWGEKCNCNFCGINMEGMKYRRKSRKRIVEEIVHLEQSYGSRSIVACDAVMPEDFKEVLSDLSELDKGLNFFYEIRPTIQTHLMDDLVRAGVTRVQPGIESLSSNVLKKMRKGVTSLQNLKLLREAKSRRMVVSWNLLAGVPEETEKDYEQLLDILPAIEHLNPPNGVTPVVVHRYSPYFNNPEKFGIKHVRPLPIYNMIYPKNANHEDLAYYFAADWESALTKNSALIREICSKIEEWIQAWRYPDRLPALYFFGRSGRIRIIKDTRRIAGQTFTALSHQAYELLNILNEPKTFALIPEQFRTHLDELLDRNFIIHHENHYLSVVTDPFIGIALASRRPESS